LKPRSIKFAAVLALSAGILSDCGARTKSASDVSKIFSKDNQSLGALLTNLCQNIRTRSEAPNMDKAALSDDECGRAGQGSDNYKKVEKSFNFEKLTSETIKGSDGNDILHVRTRGKVWLNRNLLDLALRLTKALQARQNGGEDMFSKPDPTGNGDGLANLMKVKVTELQKVEFNVAKRSFSGKINITGEGIAKLNNDIAIAGQLFSDSIGININTAKEAAFSDSLIKSVNALGIITPYANDVYVDITFDISIHSIGLQSTVTEKINSALGSSLKKILDTLLKLE
jgi:hypothetical protein